MNPKYVKIHKSRGYGNGIYRVLSSLDKDQYILKEETTNLGFKTFAIYKAHCYTDMETMKYGIGGKK